VFRVGVDLIQLWLELVRRKEHLQPSNSQQQSATPIIEPTEETRI
jgi:hypothetical protein